jgi:hypothetical protein
MSCPSMVDGRLQQMKYINRLTTLKVTTISWSNVVRGWRWTFLIPEVVSVLDCLFIGSNLLISSRTTKGDWLAYRRWMLKENPSYYKELLLVAVACVQARSKRFPVSFE